MSGMKWAQALWLLTVVWPRKINRLNDRAARLERKAEELCQVIAQYSLQSQEGRRPALIAVPSDQKIQRVLPNETQATFDV